MSRRKGDWWLMASEEGRRFEQISGRHLEREAEGICRPSRACVVWALRSQRLRAGLRTGAPPALTWGTIGKLSKGGFVVRDQS